MVTPVHNIEAKSHAGKQKSCQHPQERYIIQGHRASSLSPSPPNDQCLQSSQKVIPVTELKMNTICQFTQSH